MPLSSALGLHGFPIPTLSPYAFILAIPLFSPLFFFLPDFLFCFTSYQRSRSVCLFFFFLAVCACVHRVRVRVGVRFSASGASSTVAFTLIFFPLRLLLRSFLPSFPLIHALGVFPHCCFVILCTSVFFFFSSSYSVRVWAHLFLWLLFFAVLFCFIVGVVCFPAC